MTDARERERRLERRIKYRGLASATANNGTYEAHVLNISASGSLVAVIDDHEITPYQHIKLILQYRGEDIRVDAEVMHVKGHYLGLKCKPCTKRDEESFLALTQSIQGDSDSP